MKGWDRGGRKEERFVYYEWINFFIYSKINLFKIKTGEKIVKNIVKKAVNNCYETTFDDNLKG